MTVSPINSLTQFHSIIKSGRNVVVGFRMKPCRVCDSIWPEYQRLANRFDGVECYEVDANTQGAIADEAGVTAAPFFVVWKQGQKSTYIEGARAVKLEQTIKDAAGVRHDTAGNNTCTITHLASLSQFHNALKVCDKGIMIGFRTKQCRICDSIWPLYEKLSKEFHNVDFYEVEMNDQPAIAEEAGAFTTPFFVYYRNATKLTYCAGAKPSHLENIVRNWAGA